MKTPEPITSEQLKAIHTLYSKVKPPVEKSDMVFGYSSNRTSSTKELTKDEATAMIKALKSMQVTDPNALAADKMRKKIISMALEMGWRLANGKIDMEHVNNWCCSHGYLKKKLDDYTYSELPKLVTQFEGVYSTYLSNLNKTV